MARSARFRAFEKRLTELKKHLLPEIDPTGSYNARQYDRVRGYQLLAHAEIESCLEDLALATADAALAAWKVDGRARTCLTALVAYHDQDFQPTPKSILKHTKKTPQFVSERIHIAASRYKKRIRDTNHGIRERNVLSILLPIGVDTGDIDPTWLATTDSFGATRGEVAHLAIIHTKQPPDPANELSIVAQIKNGLADLDKVLTHLQK